MKLKMFRCSNCKKLLFKFNLNGILDIEIKCPRCGEIIKTKIN